MASNHQALQMANTAQQHGFDTAVVGDTVSIWVPLRDCTEEEENNKVYFASDWAELNVALGY